MATSSTMQTTAAPTTTYVEVFEENIAVNNNVFSDMAGSIVAVDTTNNQTTIAVNCIQSLLANCSFSSYALPITVTKGLSTFSLSLSSTRKKAADYTIFVQTQECVVISSTESASCVVFTSWWYSNSSTSTSMSKTATVTLSPAQITYDSLLVTAGVEKLQNTLAPSATAGPSSTSTAVLSTATAGPASSSPESHSSKAWIAGPVIGAVAGCALIAAGVFWFLRRKKKQRDSVVSRGVTVYDPSREISAYGSPMQDQFKEGIPAEAQGTPVAELPAHDSSWARELPS
ncbi:hypothetical protein BO70DRAFT_361902 [Aspergillus heteromorphus CBS 117.55]|uniref:Uncharacterized protein n=1 Tax=Aspergillus heteromorphus CBS 117.55 TaxID=1448321 RepID=A0A317WAN9_9EURO|nr:uncharacterized protein BO70DRAFT_361902 [Aspergillus heteromorphus CBS 117.55]PWY82975.1 hypothetical protein BO70DRAFT_361902 [Aspergillus heteromorphus CBS 117.55]